MESFEPISSSSNKPVKGNQTRPVPPFQMSARCQEFFKMPLHYPRYSREEYEGMPEWKLDCLLGQYGLPVTGSVQEKRRSAIGAFCWTTPTVLKVSTGAVCSSKL